MAELLTIDIPQAEIDHRRALNAACARFENARPPVRLFVDSPFYCKAAQVPIESMYIDSEAMIRAQLLGWKFILERVDCDVPGIDAVNLDFGSFLNGSTYGCQVLAQPGSVPGCESWFSGVGDLKRLEAIDSRVNGLRELELRYYEAFKALASQYPVQYQGGEVFYPVEKVRMNTSSEGPFSLACMIAGFDRMSLWCIDEPALVKQMLEIILEKEIVRIEHAFLMMGEEPSALCMADDYSPYLSAAMYEEFILPIQQRLRDRFGDRVYFHSCIPDNKLLAHWRDDLKIALFNGFKPQDGLGNLIRDYTPVAEAMAGHVLLEPDMDGANMMCASEEELRTAVRDWVSVFGDAKGVTLCATITGGHEVGDLAKMHTLKQTLVETCGAAV